MRVGGVRAADPDVVALSLKQGRKWRGALVLADAGLLDTREVVSLMPDKMRDGARLVALPVLFQLGGTQPCSDVQGPAPDPD
jgi:hypothetical protein